MENRFAHMCNHTGDMKQKKSLISSLKEKTKLFLDDRKNSNNLIDIITLSESEDDGIILASLRSIHRIFSHTIQTEEMYLEKEVAETEPSDQSAEVKYKLWLRQRYVDCKNRLLELLTHPQSNIREMSLCTLMKFIAMESEKPIKKIPKDMASFPLAFFQVIIEALLSDVTDVRLLIGRFQEFEEYDDVRYYTMKFAMTAIKNKQAGPVSDTYMWNLFTLLENVTMPTAPEKDVLTKLLSKLPDSEQVPKLANYNEHKKLFTSLWLAFLRLTPKFKHISAANCLHIYQKTIRRAIFGKPAKLSTSLYKKVLVKLHENVMPHMTSPLLLSDFLTESYNIGGVISLLALNGIFILVNQYNLNYPDFYSKLYALFEPSVLHVKYRARFFFLADLFLTSTHLPGYLVAAFAKKLARLSLRAPPDGLAITVPFIYNLLIRHPNCKVLIHHPDKETDSTSDPFKMDEPDPAKCHAMESSLWELKSLQSHYYHSVASETKKVDRSIPKDEIDLSELLETTTCQLFEKEFKKMRKNLPVTFEPPGGLFGNKEDKFTGLWSME